MHCLVAHNQVRSNGGPRIKNVPAARGVFRFRNKIYSSSPEVLGSYAEILYVALANGLLLRLFKQ